MKCEDINENLWEYLAGETPEDISRSVKSHVASCPACSANLESIKELRLALKREPAELDINNSRKRILGKVYSNGDNSVPGVHLKRKFMRWVAPLGVVAAALLIMVAGFWPEPTSALSLDDFLGQHVRCIKEDHHKIYTCNTQMEFAVNALQKLGLKPRPFKAVGQDFVKGDLCIVNGVMAAHELLKHGMFTDDTDLLSHFYVRNVGVEFLDRQGVKKVRDKLWGLELPDYKMAIYDRGAGDYEIYIANIPFKDLLEFVDNSVKEGALRQKPDSVNSSFAGATSIVG